jgi:thiol-disulfide isomerase/thioredoxin
MSQLTKFFPPTSLLGHEEFEMLIGRQPSPPGTILPSLTVVYFTAGWCGACKRLDFEQIHQALPDASWRKVDVDMNQFTLGYCGLRSIPSFLVIKDMTVLGALSDSRTEKVIAWLRSLV